MSEVFEALGIPDGAVPIKADEYQALPSHKRGLVSVFIRLPDPPPVAALREIVAMTKDYVGNTDAVHLASQVQDVARRALAEFDGASS